MTDDNKLMDIIAARTNRYEGCHVDYVTIADGDETKAVYEIGYQDGDTDRVTRMTWYELVPGNTPEHWHVGNSRVLDLDRAISEAMRLSTLNN